MATKKSVSTKSRFAIFANCKSLDEIMLHYHISSTALIKDGDFDGESKLHDAFVKACRDFTTHDKIEEAYASEEPAKVKTKKVKTAKESNETLKVKELEPSSDVKLPKKIESKLKNLSGCSYKLNGTWIWVYGDTKPHKDVLKENGFHYAPKKCQWYINLAKQHTYKGE